ncbi:hypothetical protein [Sulfuricurvum sp.]|uniref:hypothetical protein n=1 Tax=Sulfuricurvum sp. TaxID=2025608 RepID=UPI00261C5B57|nr:hypothetical protein [Sulfuricurvum sp.]MDD2265415.1 hypothetical protein [Sulfuricurvum sp.]MDD2784622.1 hypothetical protein [Sulfuricurvum sp.]
MRRSLGRVVILILLFPLYVWAEAYHWQLVESPKSLRVGQSALARYECLFDGSATEYSIKLNLKENTDYAISILREQDRVVKGKRINSFELIITPKRSGSIEVNLDGTVEYVPPGAIDYNAHLGRDNISKEDIVETKTHLPSFKLIAQSNSAALIGNITLEARMDHTSVRAYEPLHLSLFIKGSGNLDQFVPYELNISGVKVFAEPPQKSLSPSKDGYSGEVRQEFALVAEKPYTIPSLRLSVFDTVHNRMKMLQSAPLQVEVSEGYDISSLLDAPDLTDTSTLKRYAFYTMLIAFGVLLGEIARRLWKHRPRRKTAQFWEKAGNTKELVLMLALSGDKRYDVIINALESNTIGLSEAKKKLSTLTIEKEVN